MLDRDARRDGAAEKEDAELERLLMGDGGGGRMAARVEDVVDAEDEGWRECEAEKLEGMAAVVYAPV